VFKHWHLPSKLLSYMSDANSSFEFSKLSAPNRSFVEKVLFSSLNYCESPIFSPSSIKQAIPSPELTKLLCHLISNKKMYVHGF
jgi:hypothetical protein